MSYAEDLTRAYSDPHLRDARPCPFCKNAVLGLTRGPEGRPRYAKLWCVVCAQCLCHGPIGDSPKRAVAKWNGDFGSVHRRDLGE